MSQKQTIIADALSNMPWEDKPAGCKDVLWRYSGNPIINLNCACLCDAPSGRIAVYYGAADTYTCVAYAQVDKLLDFLKANSEVF